MRKSALTLQVLCVMFCAPFLLLAATYSALPSEFPVLRVWVNHSTLWASKSLITVFRVSLMNLTHGLMAGVMLSRAFLFQDRERRASYTNMFATLLFTVALKSDFEGLEFRALGEGSVLVPYARWLGLGTLATVVGGILWALFRGRKVRNPWIEFSLTNRDKIVLVGLFAAYLALAVLPLLGSHARSTAS